MKTFNEYLKEDEILLEAKVDLFDDVINKLTKKIFKVVDMATGKVRLSPTNEKNPKEFEVDRKIFNKDYALA